MKTIPQLCDKHNVSRTTIYREVSAGRLKLTKIGNASRVSEKHEMEWLDSLPVVSGAA